VGRLGFPISCAYIYGMIKKIKVMDTQIGTKFKMPPSYTNKHIYEIVGEASPFGDTGETENKDFWVIRNITYPEYDDRGKGRWYSKEEVEEKIENKYFNKI